MPADLSIRALHALYRAGRETPATVIEAVLERCQRHEQHKVWITLLDRTQIARWLDGLKGKSIDALPLYGVPFAIKDNIDLAGVPTTAACPAFSRVPAESAFVVQRLIEAGAIPIGKTNMDQFATGLTGTRSPYGAVRNALNPDYISGGSSSGSAVATALGLVSFALGTDTAGSGRVPAMFNKLVGLKPSCGVVSSRGVFPACRTIDCVSLFALNPEDAARIYPIMAAYDRDDPFARLPDWSAGQIGPAFRFGTIPASQRQAPRNAAVDSLMQAAEQQLVALGGIPVEIDFEPFRQAAGLLYEGPWVAERYAAIEELITKSPEVLYPVTRTVIAGATRYSAVDTYKAIYRLRELKHRADQVLSDVDVVLTPTASDIYTIAAVEANPLELNSRLGYYTNFMNLLDYAAIAIPAGTLDNGLPFGVTLFGDSFRDFDLLTLAGRLTPPDRQG